MNCNFTYCLMVYADACLLLNTGHKIQFMPEKTRLQPCKDNCLDIGCSEK